jgi:hypothetical protein
LFQILPLPYPSQRYLFICSTGVLLRASMLAKQPVFHHKLCP